MNKKFTFMVAALLAAGSVFAAADYKGTEVKDAPKAYYYLELGDDAGFIYSKLDKPTGSISFGATALDKNKQDQFLWEVVVKNNEVTLKNKATGRNLAFNDASDAFVANVIEYTNGSALVDKFVLTTAGELNYTYKTVVDKVETSYTRELKFNKIQSLENGYFVGIVDEGNNSKNTIKLTKVANEPVDVADLEKLGQGFNLSFTGSPKGADVFTNLTVVAVKSEDEVAGENADQFYLVKGKPVYKDNALDMANNTFVVLSSTSAITGFEAPNGCTYTTVKGDKLVKVAATQGQTQASHPNYKDGEYPLQNAIFTASENLNNAGKISLGHPAVYTVSSEAWDNTPKTNVWVATAGNTGALVVCAQDSEDKAAWMSTSLGTAVSVKDLVKGKMLVNVLTTAGEGYSSFDYILFDDAVSSQKLKFTTAASQMSGQKAYLTSQWYVSAGDNNTVTLINRETGSSIKNINLYSTAATGVYKAQCTELDNPVDGAYLKFVNVEGATQYDGYVNLSKEDLEEAYKLKTVARVSGFDVDVVLEQDYNSANKHSDAAIKLKEKSDNEIQWKLAQATKKVEGADGKEVSVVDTVYQITKYKYYSADKLKEAADTLKVFKYNLTSANAVVDANKTYNFNVLGENYKFEDSKSEDPKAEYKSVVLRKAGDKFVMAYAPEANNTLGDILESTDKFAKNDPSLDNNQPKNEMTTGAYAAALRFSLEPVATAAQYDVPETHFALEVGGAYLGANAKETGILTNDTTMLKSTEVDASFSFYAFSADTAVAKRPSYYLSTNGKMMYNPADSISAIDKKIAALDKVFEADKIAALYAEKANYVNGDPKNPTDALVKFQQAKYVNADSIYVAGKGINGDALKPFKFNVEEVDGQAVLKNGDKYVAVVNGVAVLRGASDAAKFNVVDAATPTSNEAVSATEVKVVAQNGSVVVKNAAGKNVVVSTILGQVVANEVLTSDNATINVPAGIVVVSVEGESFKVNVK